MNDKTPMKCREGSKLMKIRKSNSIDMLQIHTGSAMSSLYRDGINLQTKNFQSEVTKLHSFKANIGLYYEECVNVKNFQNANYCKQTSNFRCGRGFFCERQVFQLNVN